MYITEEESGEGNFHSLRGGNCTCTLEREIIHNWRGKLYMYITGEGNYTNWRGKLYITGETNFHNLRGGNCTCT